MRRLPIFILIFFSGIANAQLELADGTVLVESPYWILSYVEVEPGSEEGAKSLLSQQAELGRQKRGNLRFEALQRIGRANHFVLLEAWSNRESRELHAEAQHTIAFRNALQSHLYSPYDERPHYALETAALRERPGSESIYVITHADVVPPEQFAPCNRRPDPAGPCGNELIRTLAKQSRAHAGNLGFDVLTQSNRGNHMTVVEVWEGENAQEAHQIHPKTKAFRDAMFGLEIGSGVSSDPLFLPNPLLGSLWDERLYRAF